MHKFLSKKKKKIYINKHNEPKKKKVLNFMDHNCF